MLDIVAKSKSPVTERQQKMSKIEKNKTRNKIYLQINSADYQFFKVKVNSFFLPLKTSTKIF